MGRAVLTRLHTWLTVATAAWLLVRGQWVLVLTGVAAMFAGGFLFHLLLVPLLRVLAAAPHLVSIRLGLGRRRAQPVLTMAFVLIGQLFAGLGLATVVLFAGDGGEVARLLWAFAIGSAPILAADALLPAYRLGWTDSARIGLAAVLVLQYAADPPVWMVAAVLSGVMLAGTAVQARRLRGMLGRAADEINADAPPAAAPASPAGVAESPLLTILSLDSPAGTEFADQVAAAGRRLGYRIERTTSPSQMDTVHACVSADVAVFDATVESPTDHNLRAALYLLKSVYVVSASRTYLPLNYPARDACAPPSPRRWDNRTLVPLVVDRLTALRPHVPRPASHRGFDNAPATLGAGLDALLERRQRKVFVSFRGRHERAVADLAARLSSDEREGAKFFHTGELALGDELMTLQRRWEVLRTIERWIRGADEFWIYHTDDYAASWWTRAELALALVAPEEDRPRILVYDPGRDAPAAPGDLPHIRPGDERRIRKLLYFGAQPELAHRLGALAKSRMVAVAMGLHDEVLRPSFTQDLLLECDERAARTSASPTAFDVQGILSLGDPPLHPIAGVTVRLAVDEGHTITCATCRRDYRIEIAAPHWRWYPVRNDVPTGPDGLVLEELPNYRVLPLSPGRTS